VINKSIYILLYIYKYINVCMYIHIISTCIYNYIHATYSVASEHAILEGVSKDRHVGVEVYHGT